MDVVYDVVTQSCLFLCFFSINVLFINNTYTTNRVSCYLIGLLLIVLRVVYFLLNNNNDRTRTSIMSVSENDWQHLFNIRTHEQLVSFLLLKHNKDVQYATKKIVQYVSIGSELSIESFTSGKLSIHRPIVVTDSAESIGMKVDIAESRKQSTLKLVNAMTQYIGS